MYQCELCGEKFSHRQSLRSHQVKCKKNREETEKLLAERENRKRNKVRPFGFIY